MHAAQSLLILLNKCFKPPVHPFNLQSDGKMSYAEWQFEKGGQTIRFFLPHASASDIFGDKDVLDVGCGAAGKSVYYASLGARRVVGLDVLERYRAEALSLAARKGYAGKFEYVCADAAETGFVDKSFDTIIMNDAMEHVDNPGAVIGECMRLLRPGGRLYVNFPPYYHPYGAHLSDAIAVPWVHALFSEKTLIAVYKRLVRGKPDGAERISLRISQKPDGTEYFSYFNRMTIKRFKKLLADMPVKCLYYHEEPLRGILRPVARLPGFREFFAKMVVAVIAPPAEKDG
jgi:SAM-dependent methyltransferase